MGFFGRLFGRSALERAVDPASFEMQTVHGFKSLDAGIPFGSFRAGDIELLWKSQPNVRKVVEFAARNVASIPLHVFERESDNSRVRVRDGVLAGLMVEPGRGMGASRFWFGVMVDRLLYDRWAVMLESGSDGRKSLVHVPASRLKIELDDLNRFVGASYRKENPVGHSYYEPLDPELSVVWYGYSPSGAGSPMVMTLIDILAEGAEAVRYRRQVWRNGARSPQWIERPIDAPNWSQEAKTKFKRDFRAAYSADGPEAGGVPIMADGMKLHSEEMFSPRNALDLEGRELTAVEVATAFHISPELVGIRPGTFSNVDAYRQMLYRESLGPYITDWVEAVNSQITPRLSEGRSLYVEPHLDAKLRGSFLEEAQMITTATGAPWMGINEVRPIRNLPRIENEAYDLPVKPLNLLYGGQMPSNAGLQNLRAVKAARLQAGDDGGLRLKSDPAEEDARECAEVLRGFFKRQRKTVLSELGSKDANWWDGERWDSELGADLFALAVDVTGRVGAGAARELGLPASDYDVDRTLKFLEAVAVSRAHLINEATRRQILAALDDDLSDEAEKSTPAGVFDEAEGSRSDMSGLTLATTLTTFAVTEMGSQLGRPGVMKTWVTTSGNPRPSHAVMDGETVPIDDPYSNGLMWPGDVAGAGGDADEIANCSCVSDILIP